MLLSLLKSLAGGVQCSCAEQKDPRAEKWEWIKVTVTKIVWSSLGCCFIVVLKKTKHSLFDIWAMSPTMGCKGQFTQQWVSCWGEKASWICLKQRYPEMRLRINYKHVPIETTIYWEYLLAN